MKKFKFSFVILIWLYLLSSCNKKDDFNLHNYMVLDSVEYIEDFPKEFILDSPKDTQLDIPGMWDFDIQDSVLIIATRNKRGSWKVLSLPELHSLGNFIDVGSGPSELSEPPSVSDKKFIIENGELMSYIYDFDLGKLFKLNLYSSIKENYSNVVLINDVLPQFLFNFDVVDSVTFFCKEIGNKETQQFRYLLSKSNRSVTPSMSRLNGVSVLNGINFNIISTMTRYSNDHKKFVEMPFGLNYINIYSLNDEFKKTICIGKKLDDINFIQNMEWGDRKFMFSDLRLYDEFFGVVSIDEFEKNYPNSLTEYPTILLFDWDGNALAEIKPQNHFSSFDIDFEQNEIYLFDLQTDLFVKYDLDNILSNI